jgi:hypothetical protein
MAVPTHKHPAPGNEGNPIIGTYVVVKTGEPGKWEKGGLFIPAAPTASFDPDSRIMTLMAAVGAASFIVDDTVPDDTIRIVVGEYLKWWIP